MIYGVGRSDAAYRVMSTANAQMSAMRNIGANSDTKMLHEMDKRNTLQMEKDKFSYKMLDKLDQMDNKIRKDKLKRM